MKIESKGEISLKIFLRYGFKKENIMKIHFIQNEKSIMIDVVTNEHSKDKKNPF